jgi:hypothetical protein
MTGQAKHRAATIVENIPFSFDEKEFRKLTHIDLSGPYAKAITNLLEDALATARPKALYKVCYIDNRTEDTVELEGIRFTSRVLSRNLNEVERVFPYIVTCGTELDTCLSAETDVLARYWLDGLKEMALRTAVEHLKNHLAAEYGLKAEKLSTMNPGSGNKNVWPISQQRQLFRLLGDVEGAVGVRLTDSFLMTPNKTVSGIFFPTEVHFVSCRLCTRENCPRRRAEYTETVGLAGH